MKKNNRTSRIQTPSSRQFTLTIPQTIVKEMNLKPKQDCIWEVYEEQGEDFIALFVKPEDIDLKEYKNRLKKKELI